MKKDKSMKLYFNSLSIIELNSSQLSRITGKGATVPSPWGDTPTGPPDKFSDRCVIISSDEKK